MVSLPGILSLDFFIDGKVENRGDETWQFVKTTNGSRIVAITYSSRRGVA